MPRYEVKYTAYVEDYRTPIIHDIDGVITIECSRRDQVEKKAKKEIEKIVQSFYPPSITIHDIKTVRSSK